MDLPITYTDEEALPVVLGVDTHADAHVAVALDGLGRRLGHKTVPATEAGYALLAAWAEKFGVLDRVGIEGSGSFGVGLARFLRQGRGDRRGQPPEPPAQAQLRQARHRRR
jgi:transposase